MVADFYTKDMIRLASGCLVFIIYLISAVYVSFKIKFRFDRKVYFTMVAYLISMGLNVAFSVYFLLDTSDDSQKSNSLKLLPTKISEFVIVTVFYNFMYEMRVVRIKLESDNYDAYKAKLNKQRMFWTLTYLALITILVIEIFASFFDTIEKWSIPFILKFSAEIIWLLTNLAIIVILSTHFYYFFQRKKQALTR
jgi:hypothetical protein